MSLQINYSKGIICFLFSFNKGHGNNEGLNTDGIRLTAVVSCSIHTACLKCEITFNVVCTAYLTVTSLEVCEESTNQS